MRRAERPRPFNRPASRTSVGIARDYVEPGHKPTDSRADEALTQTLKHTLALVDVKVLDHFVVGGDAAMSFAERGLL